MQISQREFQHQTDALVSQCWSDKAARALAELCLALGATGCGWLYDFLLPVPDRDARPINSLLRIAAIGKNRTLLAYNLGLTSRLLSGNEMKAVIAYQGATWTPNLQKWPMTAWSKSDAKTGNNGALTICIPLHGPQGTNSIVFIPLMDNSPNWYSTALGFVGPLLAAEQELRAVLLSGFPTLKVSLTDQELGSLIWAAKGKTAWESARIQGISERAVVHRLRRARNKLGTGSTAMAIMTAARIGILNTL